MAVVVHDLKNLVISNAKASDKIIIISGFATPDTVEEIAQTGVEITFYYGMYRKHGLTEITYNKLKTIDSTYDNLNIYIVNDYHVHSKCYLFYSAGVLSNVLVGSANCSADGLTSGLNSEILVELNLNELKNNGYLKRMEAYALKVAKASIKCGDPSIIISSSKTGKTPITKPGKFPVSINPFVAYMPLYYWGKNEKGNKIKIVNEKSGLNWGLQSGHSKRGTSYAEAYIAVTGNLIDNHPLLFPFFPSTRTTNSGKITRRYDPVTVLWDDGTIMEMIFSGTGVERPTPSKRGPSDPYRKYPKQFTSGADGGGFALGAYLRKRMNVSERHLITMKDLKDYGREYIELTYVHDGYYEADFSGTPFAKTRI